MAKAKASKSDLMAMTRMRYDGPPCFLGKIHMKPMTRYDVFVGRPGWMDGSDAVAVMAVMSGNKYYYLEYYNESEMAEDWGSGIIDVLKQVDEASK